MALVEETLTIEKALVKVSLEATSSTEVALRGIIKRQCRSRDTMEAASTKTAFD